MADGVDVFDGAVRKKDSEFHFVIRFFNDCSSDCPLPLVSIFRMSAPKPFFPSRHAFIGIEAIYPIPLLGEMQGGSPRHAPDPTPRMREPLRLRQITLAPPQRFFRPLVLAGVRHRSNKLEFARLVSFSMSHHVYMFEGTIRHQQATLILKILPILPSPLDGLFHTRRVFRMKPLESKFHRRLHRSVVSEDSKCFV